MNLSNLNEAIDEAERFLNKARELKGSKNINQEMNYGSIKTGFVKRSSMDLTRSLSKLRNK